MAEKSKVLAKAPKAKVAPKAKAPRAKVASTGNPAVFPTNHPDGAVLVASHLKDIGVIKGFEESGPNRWVWLNTDGKFGATFKKWYAEKMPVTMPVFRAFFQYSGKRRAWFARAKGSLELMNDASYWGCLVKDTTILNSHASEQIRAQAILRATGKKSTWPKVEQAKASPSNGGALDLSEAVKLLRKAGYKVIQD